VAVDIRGKRADKVVLKKALATECYAINAAVHSYANATNDVELAANTTSKFSFYHSRRDGDLPAIAQSLHDLALGIATVTPPALNPLIPYGVTVVRLTAFATQITTYAGSVPGPRNAQVQRKAENSVLDTDVQGAVNFLDQQLDPLMYQFAGSNTVLYDNYKNARKLIDQYTVHSGFKGTITDAVTGASLAGIASISGKAQSTAETYMATFDTVTNLWTILTPKYKDVYTLTFTVPGYQTQQISNQKTLRGVKTHIDIKMVHS
jgi:hypothetical protein